MKKLMQKSISLLLMLMLLVSTLSMSALGAEEFAETNTTDFVLVVDCSGTMQTNDPDGLCLDACKMFLDLIPEEDTRIAVIAFGYATKEKYAYQNFNVKYDAEYVHTIIPLQPITEYSLEAQSKKQLEVLSKSFTNTMTPIGAATLAAVDILKTSQSKDNQAAIILMSDGIDAPSMIPNEKEAIESSITEANSHGWPIYTVQLDFEGLGNNKNPFIGESAAELLSHYSTRTGAEKDGCRKVETPSDVGEAFLNIFNRFFGSKGSIELSTIGKTGKAEMEFEIPDLVSETTLVIIGGNITKLELMNFDENTITAITGVMATDNMIVSVENDSYYAVKLICPKPGKWKMTVYGDADASIVAYHNSIQELSLRMIAVPSSTAKELTKNDTISCDSFFAYSGFDIHNHSFYKKNVANLVVVNQKTGVTKEFDMVGSENGYHYDLKISDVGSGKYQMYTRLKSTMFRSGQKISDSTPFFVKNIVATLKNSDTIQLSGNVNSASDKVDLTQYIDNPDGDPLSYSLECISDRNASFSFDAVGDYLTVDYGMLPGSFDCNLAVTEPDQSDPLIIPVHLVITDSPVSISSRIPTISVWIDSYPFQKDAKKFSVEFDAAEYASDPDGVAISVVSYETDADEGGGAVSIEQSGTTLTISPLAKGKLTLKVDVSDGVSTYTEEIPVKVISGKARFWETNWWWMAIALGVLVLIVIIIVLLSINKRVKGKWNFFFINSSGESEEVTGITITNLPVGKRENFKFSDLVNAIKPFMDNAEAIFENCSMFGMDGIVLHGVYVGNGCTVCLKNSNGVKASHNGIPVTKKLTMHSGKLSISCESEESTITITMQLT